MEHLQISATEDTPEVNFNYEANEYSIKGRALPEDAIKFFSIPMEWMRKFGEAPKVMTLDIHLDYFNSSSAKQIVEILIFLEGLFQEGNDIKANWIYESDDELMLTRGKEIESIMELPFIFTGIESEA